MAGCPYVRLLGGIPGLWLALAWGDESVVAVGSGPSPQVRIRRRVPAGQPGSGPWVVPIKFGFSRTAAISVKPRGLTARRSQTPAIGCASWTKRKPTA
jgi:hypothetical protein